MCILELNLSNFRVTPLLTGMSFRLRSSGQKTLGNETFIAKPHFTPGQLPSQKEVIEVMLFHLLPAVPGRQTMSRDEASSVVAGGLVEHWVFQNIYTFQKVRLSLQIVTKYKLFQKNVINKVKALYEEFAYNLNYPKKKRTDKWVAKTLQPFLEKVLNCLDIACKDPAALKKLEKFHGVKMTPEEFKFLEDQLGPRVMLCTTEVDRSVICAAHITTSTSSRRISTRKLHSELTNNINLNIGLGLEQLREEIERRRHKDKQKRPKSCKGRKGRGCSIHKSKILSVKRRLKKAFQQLTKTFQWRNSWKQVEKEGKETL